MVVHIANIHSNIILTTAYARHQYYVPIILVKRDDAKSFIEASKTFDVVIPICHNPVLATYMYYNLDEGDEIHVGLYSPVAEIFASLINQKSATLCKADDYHKKSSKTGVIPLPIQLL